jgi:hypothetical protein
MGTRQLGEDIAFLDRHLPLLLGGMNHTYRGSNAAMSEEMSNEQQEAGVGAEEDGDKRAAKTIYYITT